jgi:hypothetical protein
MGGNMRTAKIMTFSITPSMEKLILEQAKRERRSVSLVKRGGQEVPIAEIIL